MLIVLPPSETKATGGTPTPLRWEALSFHSLTPVREAISTDLLALATQSEEQLLAVLKLAPGRLHDALANRDLLTSPTMPAVERYTGVLYDSLDAATLEHPARSRIAIASALFGLLCAEDLIPSYRLSASTRLPIADRAAAEAPIPTMRARWGRSISDALAEVDGLVIDLRSGAYQNLGPFHDAVTVRVEKVDADGRRKVVSHFNKSYKGKLARLLAQQESEPANAHDVAEIARAAGWVVEENTSARETLTLVVE